MRNHVFISFNLLGAILLAPAICFSQAPVDTNSFNVSYVPAVSSTEVSFAKNPCGGLNCGEAYTDSFNVSDGTNEGSLVLNSSAAFTISTVPYNLKLASSNVVYQRVNNPISVATGVDLIFYEQGAITSLGEPDNTIDLLPSKRTSSEIALRDQIINDGAESILHNNRTGIYQSINSDVERIDVIFNSGLKTSAPQNAGFLVIERGGNDNIKVAAIMSLSTSGEPATYGVLESITNADWGVGRNTSMRTMSYISDDNGVNYGAFSSNGLQTLAGNFVSFLDLGIAVNQVVYGYSIFPGDVDPIADPTQILTDPDTLPKNTSGTDGGLDLVYASGAFDSDSKLVSLSHIPSLSTYGLFALTLMLLFFGTRRRNT